MYVTHTFPIKLSINKSFLFCIILFFSSTLFNTASAQSYWNSWFGAQFDGSLSSTASNLVVPSSGTQNVTIGYNEGFEVSSSLNPFCNFGFGIELQYPRTIKNLPNYNLDFLDLFASLRVPLQIFNFSIYPLARLGYSINLNTTIENQQTQGGLYFAFGAGIRSPEFYFSIYRKRGNYIFLECTYEGNISNYYGIISDSQAFVLPSSYIVYSALGLFMGFGGEL